VEIEDQPMSDETPTPLDAMFCRRFAETLRAMAKQVEDEQLDAERTIQLVNAIADPLGRIFGGGTEWVRENFSDPRFTPAQRAWMLLQAVRLLDRLAEQMSLRAGGVN
jgi:hypothetical protein